MGIVIYVWIDKYGELTYSGVDDRSHNKLAKRGDVLPEWFTDKVALLQTVDVGVEIPGVGKRLQTLMPGNAFRLRVEGGEV